MKRKVKQLLLGYVIYANITSLQYSIADTSSDNDYYCRTYIIHW